jgi:hypothetical protein
MPYLLSPPFLLLKGFSPSALILRIGSASGTEIFWVNYQTSTELPPQVIDFSEKIIDENPSHVNTSLVTMVAMKESHHAHPIVPVSFI